MDANEAAWYSGMVDLTATYGQSVLFANKVIEPLELLASLFVLGSV